MHGQDAELRKLAVRQIADGREVDGALGEALCVLSQAGRRQPLGDGSHGSATSPIEPLPDRPLMADRSGPGRRSRPDPSSETRICKACLAQPMASAYEG